MIIANQISNHYTTTAHHKNIRHLLRTNQYALGPRSRKAEAIWVFRISQFRYPKFPKQT